MHPPRRAPALLFPLLLGPAGSLAFEGKVVTPGGAPVADALISIQGRAGISRTDPGGMFTWQPDPPLPFDLLVVLPGGQRAAPVRVETLPAAGPLLITASPSLAEEITVTAEAAPHIQFPPGSAVSTLARDDLERRHPERLTDVVENIPGVGRLGTGHDAVPSIRGLARGRTLLLIDGGRVSTERRAGPSASFLDPFFLEAVEVSRGPGSVAYGSDALGGVIQARTRRPEPSRPLRLRSQASLGTGIPERAAGAELSRGFAEGGMLLSARFREFDDYRSPSGDVPNSSASDHGFAGRFDHEAGPGMLSLGWSSDMGRDVERPTPASNGARVSNPREDSHRLSFSYQLDPLADATLLGVSGFVGGYRLVTEQDLPPAPGAAREISLSDVRARDFEVRANGIRPLGKARMEVGLDLNGRVDLEARGSDPNGEQTSIEDARRVDTAAYLTGERALAGSLVASGGVRFDQVATRNRGGLFGNRSTSNEGLSGFASLGAGPYRGFSVTGQVSRGFHDPTLSDRFFKGISGRGLAEGNPDLDPETSLQHDLSLRYSARRFRSSVFGYRYRIYDLIERFEGGRSPSGQRLFFFRNHSSATIRGAELEVRAQLIPRVTLEVGAQAARGEDDDGAPLDDIPTRNISLQGHVKITERLSIFLRAGLYGDDDRPGPTEARTPGYAKVDIGGSLRLSDNAEIRFITRNLLDREYPASQDQTAVLAPGRSGLLTLAASLGG